MCDESADKGYKKDSLHETFGVLFDELSDHGSCSFRWLMIECYFMDAAHFRQNSPPLVWLA
jgi:hypothetical protein